MWDAGRASPYWCESSTCHLRDTWRKGVAGGAPFELLTEEAVELEVQSTCKAGPWHPGRR